MNKIDVSLIKDFMYYVLCEVYCLIHGTFHLNISKQNCVTITFNNNSLKPKHSGVQRIRYNGNNIIIY